ncbi:MAG: GyrI-like domain-containing protein [Bacteroidia bacterium]
MQPGFETISEKKLIGQHIEMSLAANKTGLLWQGFMPRRKEIANNRNADFVSLQIYPPDYFSQAFDPHKKYTKWALIEVSDFDTVPDGMESFILPAGLYAVFQYHASVPVAAFFQQLYMGWLPQSGYALDQRPHFEVLGEKYKKDDPNSEEEVWIPVKLKTV